MGVPVKDILDNPRHESRALVHRVLEDIKCVCGGDSAVFFTLRQTRLGLIYSGVESICDDDDVATRLARIEQQPCFKMSVGEEDRQTLSLRTDAWSISRPRPEHTNRMTSFDQDYKDFEGFKTTETWKLGYASFGVADQARALIYHDDRFVGWLSIWRHGTNERMSGKDLKRYNARVGEWSRQLIGAESLLDERVLTGPCHAVFTLSDGRIEWATPELERWLTRQRQDTIASMLCGLDSRALESGAMLLDGVSITATRMEMANGTPSAYMLVFDSSRHIEVDALALLTPIQREVVSLLCKGLTNTEIAEHLGRTPRSIKRVVTRLFAEYDVHSRAELVMHLSPKHGAR